MPKQPYLQAAPAASWTLWRRSLPLLRRYPEQLVLLALLPSLTIQLGTLVFPRDVSLGIAIYLLGGLWLVINTPVLYYFQLQVAHGREVLLREAYTEGLVYVWRLVVLSAMTTLLVLAGLLLFIVPGFIMVRRYLLAPYYLIDKDLPVREAMRRSAADSKPVAGYLWGTVGVTVALAAASFLVGLGLSMTHVAGVSGVVSTVLELASVFLLALRYLDTLSVLHPATKRPRARR